MSGLVPFFRSANASVWESPGWVVERSSLFKVLVGVLSEFRGVLMLLGSRGQTLYVHPDVLSWVTFTG